MTAALETRSLCKSFGALTVAEQIDFRLDRGARHALIGPNGAGKTTFINMLTGGSTRRPGKSCSAARTSPISDSPTRQTRTGTHVPDQYPVPQRLRGG